SRFTISVSSTASRPLRIHPEHTLSVSRVLLHRGALSVGIPTAQARQELADAPCRRTPRITGLKGDLRPAHEHIRNRTRHLSLGRVQDLGVYIGQPRHDRLPERRIPLAVRPDQRPPVAIGPDETIRDLG